MVNVEFTEEEIKWVKKLQNLLKKQPSSLVGFCTGTNINFYQGEELPTCGINNEQIDGSIDSLSVDNKNWDAGAY